MSTVTEALVVGGIAFAAMISAAGGVLWFTARNHRQQRQG
jgi:hypothetical protein